jgi:hypothetical protein
MAELRLLRVHPAFRMIALARPPGAASAAGAATGAGAVDGGGVGWLSPEILAMFLFLHVRPLDEQVRTRATVSAVMCGR